MLLTLAGVLLQRWGVRRKFMSSCSAQPSLNSGLVPILLYTLTVISHPSLSPRSWPERSGHRAYAQRISVGS